jgi:dolichol-phosphate mannosyltransferase
LNEERILPSFWRLLAPTLEELTERVDVAVVFVNNASTDKTIEVLDELHHKDNRVKYLTLARKVDYETALETGLRAVDADLYAMIDADGEDPPELLLNFIEEIEHGADVAYGVRLTRAEPGIRVLARKLFYRLVAAVADDPFRVDTGEFSMFRRNVRDAMLAENNSYPFLRASMARVGFASVGVPHDRNPRLGGQSRLNALGMLRFAVAGALSSSTYPLRLPLYLLPMNLILIGVLALVGLLQNSLRLLASASIIGLLLLLSQQAFLSVYLARTYKNGLMRPNAFIDLKRSKLP